MILAKPGKLWVATPAALSFTAIDRQGHHGEHDRLILVANDDPDLLAMIDGDGGAIAGSCCRNGWGHAIVLPWFRSHDAPSRGMTTLGYGK
jgi:hypothetical protein